MIPVFPSGTRIMCIDNSGYTDRLQIGGIYTVRNDTGGNVYLMEFPGGWTPATWRFTPAFSEGRLV